MANVLVYILNSVLSFSVISAHKILQDFCQITKPSNSEKIFFLITINIKIMLSLM